MTQRGKSSSSIFDFDSDMYWKASYHKAESERLKLLNELAQLRQERDPLRSNQESNKSRGHTALGKRKRDTSVQPRNKKNKNESDPNLLDDEIDLEFDDANGPTTGMSLDARIWPTLIRPDRQAFLRGFTALRHSVGLPVPDQGILVNTLQVISNSISKMLLLDMQTTRRPPADQEARSIREVCTAFKRVYPSILGGLNCVEPHPGEGDDHYIPALSDVVKVFQAFLGRLHKFALDEFVRREREVMSKRRGSGFRAEDTQEMRSQGHSPASEQDLVNVKKIIRVLVCMMTALDVSKDAHCQLLEGYLCAILDHIGSSLSLLVFADSDTLQKKQAGLLPPNGLLDMGQVNLESATGTATIEGPYVIFILRKGVEFLLANAKSMPEKSLLSFAVQSSAGNQGGSKDLRQRIEETLQNTLLRGAFGDDDATFYDSLRRNEEEEEADLNQMVNDIKQKEDSVERFIGELWEHLGWSILSGKRGI